MAQEEEEEDLTFNVEEVQTIVRDNIEFCLGGNVYSHSRCPQWITVITEKTLARLSKLNKPFKYIMRMTVTQKNGSALHTAAAYFWDISTDGTCTVRQTEVVISIINNNNVDVYDIEDSRPISTKTKLSFTRVRTSESFFILGFQVNHEYVHIPDLQSMDVIGESRGPAGLP